jgi:nucleosome binding factor SPN SPT16 subunit
VCCCTVRLQIPPLFLHKYQGGWGFLDLEKSDGEEEEDEASSEGFDPGSEAEEEEDESSDDMSDEVSGRGGGGVEVDGVGPR